MCSRVLDKNSTSFAQECTVLLFLELARSAGAAATSGVGLPGPAADHRNSVSSWRYLATWRELRGGCCLALSAGITADTKQLL